MQVIYKISPIARFCFSSFLFPTKPQFGGRIHHALLFHVQSPGQPSGIPCSLGLAFKSAQKSLQFIVPNVITTVGPEGPKPSLQK